MTEGDWTPNGKFEDWRSLPARIAATGSVAGVWIAPMMVPAGHAIVKEHPDWLQRLPDGTPAITFPGEATGLPGTPIHFLDPDHPPYRASSPTPSGVSRLKGGGTSRSISRIPSPDRWDAVMAGLQQALTGPGKPPRWVEMSCIFDLTEHH